MTGRRRLPNPVRSEPVLPAGITLAGYVATTLAVGLCLGGGLSGFLAGNGFAVLAPSDLTATVAKLVADPGSPAVAWPGEPRPGPAWLTWLCVGVVAIVWCSTALIVVDLIDSRWRKRHRPGMATTADLRRVGLDRRRARVKARHEYPELGRQSRWWRR
ncbi:hypothetical protein AB0H76_09775 [Nocardia sp. NPDC050712]|uniref:hypothetical protein n=1 Tax=Nocardia sp. NPDC050712 TaxID=3155518 RepID=UPI00340AA54A